MTNSVVVKVGVQSKLKIVGCKSYRAISIDDLQKTVNDKKCNIIIIEKIASEEEKKAYQVIKEIQDNNNKAVVAFFIPDNDEITSGIADELELEIFMTVPELYKYIFEKTGFKLNPFLGSENLTESMKVSLDKPILGFEDNFNNAGSEFNNAGADVVDKFNSAGSSFDNAGSEFNNAGSEVVDNFNSAGSDIEYAGSNFEGNFSNTGSSFDNAGSDTECAGADVEDNINNAGLIFDNAGSSFEDNFSNAGSEFDNAGSSFEDNFSNAGSEFDNAGSSAEDTASSFEGYFDNAGSEFSNAGSEFSNAGSSFEGYFDNAGSSIEDTALEDTDTSDEEKETAMNVVSNNVEIDKLKEEIEKLKAERDNIGNDKIAELEKVIEQLKSERSIIENKFNEILSDKNVIDSTTSNDELEKVNSDNENKIKEQESVINQLNEEIKSLTEKLSNSEVKEGNAVEEKTELENKIAELEKQLSDNQNTEDSANTEKAELENKLRMEMEYRSNTVEMFNSALKELQIRSEKLAETEKSNSSLKKENDTLYSEINRINNDCNAQKQLVSECNVKINELTSESSGKDKSVEEANNKVEELNREIRELNDKLDKKDSKINLITDRYNEAVESLKTSSESIAKFTSEAEGKDNEIQQLKIKNENLLKQAELANGYADETSKKLQNEIDMLTAKLSMTEDKLAETEKKLDDTTAKSRASIVDPNLDDIDDVAKSLSDALEKERAEKDELKKQVESTESKVRGYQEIIKQLSGDGASGIIGKPAVKSISYTGLAQIITVCGSGSYGITMTAFSIAKKLASSASKVLLIDLDLVTPSADAYVNKSPIVKGIPDIAVDQKSTSFGIFLEYGVDTVSQYIDRVVIPALRVGGGGLDFFSGAYYRPDQLKITTADFSTLLQLLSARYTYIIIDMGRLGNSELNDSLIKAISDIAYRNVFVTTQDKFDIRNFRFKLDDFGIRTDNSSWLINMSESKKLDDKSIKTISPMKYGLTTFDPELRGKHESFYKTRVTKDTFDLFLNKAVFNGK